MENNFDLIILLVVFLSNRLAHTFWKFCTQFSLIMVFFAVQKLLSLVRAHLFIFVSIFITLGGG